jgi:hypothetical protein
VFFEIQARERRPQERDVTPIMRDVKSLQVEEGGVFV